MCIAVSETLLLIVEIGYGTDDSKFGLVDTGLPNGCAEAQQCLGETYTKIKNNEIHYAAKNNLLKRGHR